MSDSLVKLIKNQDTQGCHTPAFLGQGFDGALQRILKRASVEVCQDEIWGASAEEQIQGEAEPWKIKG